MDKINYRKIRSFMIYRKKNDGTITLYPRFSRGGYTFEKIYDIISLEKPNVYYLNTFGNKYEKEYGNDINENDIIDDCCDNLEDNIIDASNIPSYPIWVNEKEYHIIYVLLDGYHDSYRFMLE